MSYLVYCISFSKQDLEELEPNGAYFGQIIALGKIRITMLCGFFSDLIHQHVYSRIDFKFLIPGHTYGPTDRHFAIIEKFASKIEVVYTPQQWYDNVRKAVTTVGSRVEVAEMKQEYFQDYRAHLRKRYTERNKDLYNQPLDFVRAVWFNFVRGEKMVDGKLVSIEHPTEVWVRHTYNVEEMPQCVSLLKKRKALSGFECIPPLLYHKYPIPIKREKAQDVKSLLSKYVPSEYQGFYTNISVDNESDSETE